MGVKRLLPQVTLPEQSREGALTGHEKTAVLASPNLSVPSASARLKVPDAGFTRAHVSWFRLTEDELVSVACFPASSLDRLVMSAIAIGPVDA